MSPVPYLKDIVTVGVILSLLGVGALITLKSGLVTVGDDQGRVVLGNLSQLVVTLAGCLIILLMLQEIVGFRMAW